MALATRVLARPQARRAAEATPVELTIDEARKQYELGSLDLAVAELKELERLDAIAKEHGNAANRQGTKVKNAVKAYVVAEELGPNDELQIGETGYRYDYNVSEKIDTKKLYEMMQSRKITEAQFLECISVNKADATRLIGEHVLMSITESTPGKKMDLRSRKLDNPAPKPTIVRVSTTQNKKLNQANTLPPPVINGRKTLMIKRKVKTYGR